MSAKLPPVIRGICGEYKGWNAHKRNGESVCGPCKEAQAAYAYEWRHRTGRTKSKLYTEAEIAEIKRQSAAEERGALSRAHLTRRASRRRIA